MEIILVILVVVIAIVFAKKASNRKMDEKKEVFWPKGNSPEERALIERKRLGYGGDDGYDEDDAPPHHGPRITIAGLRPTYGATTKTDGRLIVIDTETTGFRYDHDRIVELAAIEIENGRPTGRKFHGYFNPERSIPRDATAVHGLTWDFLKDQPRFIERADELLSFIDKVPLVMHNAEFDLNFLVAEFMRCSLSRESWNINFIDTLHLARRKHPDMNNSLDALCKRYRIDDSRREKHSALVDAELLIQIFNKLTEDEA